jgi:hypothetical protein
MTIMRIDRYETTEHGQELGYCDWMGGPTLSNVKGAHVMAWQDDPNPYQPGRYVDTGLRRAARITGEPDTWFSVPAVATIAGKRTKGWLGCEDGVYQFHPIRPHR